MKGKVFSYFLNRCKELKIESDLYDFDAYYDSNLSYSENITLLEENFFKNIPSVAEATLNNIKQEQQQFKQELDNNNNLSNLSFKENWEFLATTRSIYILGGVRSGKSCLAFGLCKKLQPFKEIYYFNFPQKQLLTKEGFKNIENLNDISNITDGVIVIDELALCLKKYEKKNNDELEKILTLAGQNNLTIIFISQVSQLINKRLESLIDCFFILDIDYHNLKNGSRAKNMIKDYCTFQPEFFKLEKGEFLFYSRNFPVFEKFTIFEKHKDFTTAWSYAYKNDQDKKNKSVITKIKKLVW